MLNLPPLLRRYCLLQRLCRTFTVVTAILAEIFTGIVAESKYKGGDEMAGIKEVAEEAGVSTATVSRALRGLHHVNQQTRDKIIAAAEKLNYPLNTERQGVSSGRTNSVGVVAPYISRWYF